jgi:hypothetical protein
VLRLPEINGSLLQCRCELVFADIGKVHPLLQICSYIVVMPIRKTNRQPSLYVWVRRVRYRDPVSRGREILGGSRGRKFDIIECAGGGDWQHRSA